MTPSIRRLSPLVRLVLPLVLGIAGCGEANKDDVAVESPYGTLVLTSDDAVSGIAGTFAIDGETVQFTSELTGQCWFTAR